MPISRTQGAGLGRRSDSWEKAHTVTKPRPVTHRTGRRGWRRRMAYEWEQAIGRQPCPDPSSSLRAPALTAAALLSLALWHAWLPALWHLPFNHGDRAALRLVYSILHPIGPACPPQSRCAPRRPPTFRSRIHAALRRSPTQFPSKPPALSHFATLDPERYHHTTPSEHHVSTGVVSAVP